MLFNIQFPCLCYQLINIINDRSLVTAFLLFIVLCLTVLTKFWLRRWMLLDVARSVCQAFLQILVSLNCDIFGFIVSVTRLLCRLLRCMLFRIKGKSNLFDLINVYVTLLPIILWKAYFDDAICKSTNKLCVCAVRFVIYLI